MAEPYIGEICIFPYTFAPRDWGFCDGAYVNISQFSTLFAVIGINFGGNATSNFQLPNLENRAPLHVGGVAGQGPGLSYHSVGDRFGYSSVALSNAHLPQHKHTAYVEKYTGSEVNVPTQTALPGFMAQMTSQPVAIEGYTSVDSNVTNMATDSMATVGSYFAHENRQPSLVMHYCIAMDGIWPPRS